MTDLRDETTAKPAFDVRGLVDPERGLARRAIYSDRDVYDLELRRIFARSWLYVAHISQLPEPGDYLTTMMGEDPVIVVRGSDGIIRAFLNACRHRGMRVCRADEGNTSFFRCPYHSWTYSTTGTLRGVPKFRQAYEGMMEKEDWGLLEVAQLDEYQGFVFATWAADTPPLREYLGGFAFYLDLVFGRDPGGVELVAGAHKWTIDANWKHPVENFACDMYHVQYAHQRPAELGLMGDMTDTGFEVSAGMGYVGHDLSRPLAEDDGENAVHGYWTMPNPYTDLLKEQRRRIAEEHGEMAARMVPMGHASIFPSFSFLDLEQLRLVRVQHPLGPDKVMIHQWCAIDVNAPPDVKTALRRQYELTFGPAGLLEQDDGENWRECQNGVSGVIGRSLDTNMMLGLGQDRTTNDLLGTDNLPGHGGSIWSEANQRQFYRHWNAFMEASGGWEDIGPRLDEIDGRSPR
jgi:3-phenylpropionate/trans-cinnamate dioxygenase alpha subunit